MNIITIIPRNAYMITPGLYLDTTHTTHFSTDEDGVFTLTDYSVTPPHAMTLTPAMLGAMVTYVATPVPIPVKKAP